MDRGKTKNVRDVNKWKPPNLSKQYVSYLFMNAIKPQIEFKTALCSSIKMSQRKAWFFKRLKMAFSNKFWLITLKYV